MAWRHCSAMLGRGPFQFGYGLDVPLEPFVGVGSEPIRPLDPLETPFRVVSSSNARWMKRTASCFRSHVSTCVDPRTWHAQRPRHASTCALLRVLPTPSPTTSVAPGRPWTVGSLFEFEPEPISNGLEGRFASNGRSGLGMGHTTRTTR